MKGRRVKASHNPVSNLKLASGISPVSKMLNKGITISLGTDSPCSNNSADMFETMKIAGLLHKGIDRDPTLVSAEKVLEMATIDGARALLWDKEIGSIEPGKKADLIIVDLKKPHLSPLYKETSHLVYAAKASDVETAIINGKLVMESHAVTTVDIEKIMLIAEKAKTNLLEKIQHQR
jgi:5-methylthioadenosine/S-adenosylhomocysteine deaminase